MNKKKLLYVVLAASLVLNCVLVFGGCMNQGPLSFLAAGGDTQKTGDDAKEPNVPEGEADISEHAKMVEKKLEAIDEIINNYYLYDEEIDQESLLEGIYAGYVAGLKEPYTTYYTAEQFADLMESSSGEYSGIGVSVSQNMNTGIITVINPFENGPGYEAGMRKDDILFAVEGEEVTGVDINNVVAKIKGEEGTTVDVTVFRQSTNEYIDMTIERRVVQNPTVEYEMLAEDIGFIHISEFDEVTVSQFDQALEDLQKQGAKGLIFDIRDNPGGLLSGVCQMLDRILPKEQLLVYTMDKNGNKEEYFSEDDEELSLPIVIVMNGNSASASEIFSATLHDHGKARLVGTTTFGKGIVQTLIPISDGSGVKLTQSEYYTPNGVCIHGDGVAPDVEVELDRSTLENGATADGTDSGAVQESEEQGRAIDNQLAAAIEELRTMMDGENE